MVRILLIFLFASITVQLFSQSKDCEQTLNSAAAEFDAGRFYGLPSLLKPCLDKGFSQEQKVRAYLLLTQAYLILDDPIAAETSYLQLLKADPEYVANPARDPVDVYYLSKRFITTPVFTPNFLLGVNTSLPRPIFSLNTSSTQTQRTEENVLKLGYQVGGTIDWNLNERWSIGIGLQYSKKTFKSVAQNSDEGTHLEFTEKQDWIDLPLYVKYSHDSGAFRPFVYTGISANFLIGSKLAPDGVDLNSPSPPQQQIWQGPDIDILYKRNMLNRSLVLGGGFKYKVSKNFLFLDVRYMGGLNNIVKNPYTTSDGKLDKLLTNYEYSSDFFRIDNLSLSVGFIKPLYDPRKRKPVVTGLLQKLGLKKAKK
ncbi:hypothetical protein WSM22_28100 [Cytophagales bacterium WSM2-2]|nr:hypothetical protein WSM22_28100 [Cytophagales bacterium WSM2-2]